jgi:hypothetical protein
MRGLVRAILLGLVGAAAIASAGDQTAEPAQSPPAPAAASAPASQSKDDIQDFVPSEKVGADDAVSFPVDI